MPRETNIYNKAKRFENQMSIQFHPLSNQLIIIDNLSGGLTFPLKAKDGLSIDKAGNPYMTDDRVKLRKRMLPQLLLIGEQKCGTGQFA